MPEGSVDNSHYLDKYGCAFGKVTENRITNLEGDMLEVKKSVSGINTKLWTLIIMLLTEMAGAITYLLTHRTGG